MGIAAYNRGTKLLRTLLDREAEERAHSAKRTEIFRHEYVDFRDGETRAVWCDSIGALVNQRRDDCGKPLA